MENLKSYLDGELDIAQQAEVETHLRNDEELQRMVEEFSAISSTLKTADRGEPYGFEKLEARLNSTSQVATDDRKKIWRLAAYWSASMACLALGAVIVFPVFAQAKMSAKKSAFQRGASADAPASMAAPMVAEAKASGGFDRTKNESSDYADKSVTTATSQANASPSATLNSPEQSLQEDGAIYGRTKGAGQGEVKSDAGDQSFQSEPSPKVAIAEKPINPEKEDALVNGSPGTERSFAKKKSTDIQNGVSFGKSSMPEGEFKSSMRAQRDKTAQPVTSLGDTPHGIYLERAGQVQVKVDDLMRAVNEATGMVQGYDGFVTASDLQNQADGGSATMTVRVPTKNFNAALDKLQAMGEVLSVNSNSQDITSETVDNSARMISWADEEDRLIKELNKAKENYRKLQIRAELRNVRANLESYRASVKSLTERAKYSTINVSFVRGDKAVKAGGTGNWAGDALKGAKDNLSSIGQVGGTLGIYFLVFAPIWLPFAIAAYIIRKKSK